MVFIVFSRDSWGFSPINTLSSHRGTLGSGYIHLSPDYRDYFISHEGLVLNVAHSLCFLNDCNQRNTTPNQDFCGSSIRFVSLLPEYHIHQTSGKISNKKISVDLEDRHRQKNECFLSKH